MKSVFSSKSLWKPNDVSNLLMLTHPGIKDQNKLIDTTRKMEGADNLFLFGSHQYRNVSTIHKKKVDEVSNSRTSYFFKSTGHWEYRNLEVGTLH